MNTIAYKTVTELEFRSTILKHFNFPLTSTERLNNIFSSSGHRLDHLCDYFKHVSRPPYVSSIRDRQLDPTNSILGIHKIGDFCFFGVELLTYSETCPFLGIVYLNEESDPRLYVFEENFWDKELKCGFGVRFNENQIVKEKFPNKYKKDSFSVSGVFIKHEDRSFQMTYKECLDEIKKVFVNK